MLIIAKLWKYMLEKQEQLGDEVKTDKCEHNEKTKAQDGDDGEGSER